MKGLVLTLINLIYYFHFSLNQKTNREIFLHIMRVTNFMLKVIKYIYIYIYTHTITHRKILFLNAPILLSSEATMTWAHYAILVGKFML